MRVLLVSQEMPPETGWGGIGTYVATLAPALAAAGAQVRVLSVVRGQHPSDRELGDVVVHRRPLRRPPAVGHVTRLREAWERLSLAAAVDHEVRSLDFAPDVVEAPEWRAEGLVLALRRTAPVVVRMHSAAEQLFPFSGRPGLDSRLAIALERRALIAADLVVSTPSNLDELAAQLGGYGLLTRAINLPVPVLAAAPAPPPPPRVTFVGRLERRKGPETLVSAARAVLDAVPETRFSFVGADTGQRPGSYLDLLKRQATRLGVSHAVEFLGHRPHADAMDEIRRSWVCAFPARQETFGYGAAEAAGLGRPVVASRIPPFAALFRDGTDARLVPVDDAPAWADAIIRLLSNADVAAQIGAAGRERVLARCAPDQVASQMLGAYAEAIGRARSPHRRGGRPTPVP
jgi:glycogen(starch) synthase